MRECISDDIIYSQPGLTVSKHIQGGHYHPHTMYKKKKHIKQVNINKTKKSLKDKF